MPVFESTQQGQEKSSALRALAEPWFDDHLPDIRSKDAQQHLRGFWLFEVAELDAISKAESSRLKAFLTRRKENYRRVWRTFESKEPRQCTFAGTTNERFYLRDHTGNRRIWPVACLRQADVAAIRRDRDQLFAEARWRYEHGERAYPTNEEEERLIRPQQEARFEEDLWTRPIFDHLVIVANNEYIRRKHAPKDPPIFTSTSRIAREVLDMKADKSDGNVGNRIGKILQRFKWIPKHTEYGNIWFPPDQFPPAEPAEPEK